MASMIYQERPYSLIVLTVLSLPSDIEVHVLRGLGPRFGVRLLAGRGDRGPGKGFGSGMPVVS